MTMRLVLVTRRFWPLVGGAEAVMANLASAFQRLGARVTILTARWENSWPRDVVHREVPVVRLANPRQRGWGTLRYMLALANWLQNHRPQFDLVYVSMLKHDAYASIGALRRHGLPVVLRAEGSGETGDCRWQDEARFGRRIRRQCFRAQAVVAPSAAIRDELLRAGYAADRVHHVPNGVALLAPRSPARQAAVRQELRDVNFDLAVEPGEPVVVYTGRLHEKKGLRELVDAWSIVARHRPGARLWLIGEGPLREELFRRISDRELRGRVLLPGAFDDVQDVLATADLFVLPSYEEGMSVSLLEAMAAGLPVVASDIPGNRQLVEHAREGLLVPPRTVEPLAAAIRRLLDDRCLAAQVAAAARRKVESGYSLERVARRHLELFAGLVEASRVGQEGGAA